MTMKTGPGSGDALLPLQQRRPASDPRVLGRLHTFARRRAVITAATLAIPVLCLLLGLELRSQASLKRQWAVEWAAIELVAPLSVRTGRIELASWRNRWYERERELSGDEIDVEASDIWPQWWGNAEVVGPSPFDYVPSSAGGRRVLFLTSYEDYLERMNTHTYELVDAAARYPGLVVDVWGPGWAGYDWSVPLSVNVKRRANRVATLERAEAEYEVRVAERRARREREDRRRGIFGWRFGEPRNDDWELPEEEESTPPPWDSYDDACDPATRFDFAWTISDIYKAGNMAHVDVLDCGTLLVQQVGDCHSHRCMQEWYPHANNITASKYAFELHEVFGLTNVRKHYPNFEMGIFAHSPDTANEWDFWPLPWDQRDREAAVFGFDGDFYPLRTTVTEYLERSAGDPSLPASPISRHPHPGYEVDVPEQLKTHPLETYETGHASYAVHRAIREDFASGMRRAQICVFDASLERKLIRKYAQAFLSGCVVASDLPTEHEEALGKFVIVLQPTWPIERIDAEIRAFLSQPERLEQMALDAFAYARKSLTTTAKISDMLRVVDAYRAGFRGYDRELLRWVGDAHGQTPTPSRSSAARIGVEATHRDRE